MKLVGLSGISGVGKTTLISELVKVLPEGFLSVLSFDNYYKPIHLQVKDVNGRENFDLPGGVDHEKFLKDMAQLKAGMPVRLTQYHFNNPAAKTEDMIIEPAQVLVVEGIFIYHFEAIREQLDMKIFIEVPHDITLERRLKRDMHERGYAEGETEYQWYEHVLPGYEQFLLPYRSQADLIIDNSMAIADGVKILKERLMLL